MTLNSYVNIYRNFTIDHKELKSFYVGNIDHFITLKNRLYPALIMTLNPTTINEMTVDLKAQFIVLDRIVSEVDLLEVQNRTHEICRDIIAISNQVSSADPIQTDITPSDTEKHNSDLVAGCFCDVQIQVFDPINPCSVPIDDSPYPSPTGAYIRDKDTQEIIYTLYPGQYYDVEILQEIIDTITANTGAVIDPIS